jgi:predicted amidohydrolase
MGPRFLGLAFVLALACAVSGAAKEQEPVKTMVHLRDFTAGKRANGLPEGWTTWAARAEIAPRFAVDAKAGRTGRGAIRIGGGGNSSAFGTWRRRVEGVVAGRTYRFIAYYRTRDIAQQQRCVSARLDWLDANGDRARPPDYALDRGKEDAWTRVEYVATAPENAHSVVIELSLGWAAKGVVWWDDIRLLEETPPKERVVRAMTVYHRPRNTKSAAESVEEFCQIVEAAASQQPDIVCLPEGVTMVGTGMSYAQSSEPIPGPTTHRLGALAKRLHCYLVAGIFERVGSVIYNTAVLIGRQGELVGAYRKTHLPREEVEGGLTPGDSYPVFQTDFGKAGLLICWDVQFPEPARALGIQGAEVILLPIAGGSEVLARARAIENHLFLITSSYDMKTFIVDPTGDILAEATREQPVAVAELHLDRKIVQPWLGDMKPRTWKERRPDIPVPVSVAR